MLLVVITRGSFRKLAEIQVRSWWALFVGLVIQIPLNFIEVPRNDVNYWGFAALLFSYALLLAFCFVNLPIKGISLIMLGVLLNAVPIALNQGMPYDPASNDKDLTSTVKNRPERDGDILLSLTDVIAIPKPFYLYASFGDLILSAGIINVMYSNSRRDKRKKDKPKDSDDGSGPEPEQRDIRHHSDVQGDMGAEEDVNTTESDAESDDGSPDDETPDEGDAKPLWKAPEGSRA